MTVVAIPKAYEPGKIEPKWQDAWRAEAVFTTPDPQPGRADAYVFVAPPFTSGNAHMGHVRSYSIGDAHVRFRRARGEAVLFSLGFDSFGLPAELEAIKRKLRPEEWVEACSKRMREQFDQLGFSFDWSRTFLTCEADMYRWSQWIFVTLFEANLIYQADGHVDWCENCQTVLASSQAEEGCCWRCHGELGLVRRPQWYLRLSAYNEENDRRIEELTGLWSDAAIAAQRTLLGRVNGVEFEGVGLDGSPITLFTPHPDEIPSASFVGISPRHPDIDHWLDEEARERLSQLRDVGLQRNERSAEDVPLLDTGKAVHVSGVSQPLPVIVSPTVDVRYGPTAVLGLPAVDRADRAIDKRLSKSGPATAWKAKLGPLVKRPSARYRASDFPISRQRAWGAPIPIVHCPQCGAVPIPVDELPVRLPPNLDVSDTRNALAEDPEFVACECPKCGGAARREIDTLDCHVDVFWIYMAVAVTRDERADDFFSNPELRRWLPVSQFIHGADTAGFVLDERMVAKALRDLGILDWLQDGEPYGPTLMHEMVLLDGRKMSKHLGNVVTPEEIVNAVGADALRFSVLHAAAPGKRFSWDGTVIEHCSTFLNRLWDFAEPRLREMSTVSDVQIETSTGMRRRLVSWCEVAMKRITQNYETLEMHRATRNLITMLTRIEGFEQRIVGKGGELTERDREAIRASLLLLLQLLAPISPHLAEELWERAGLEGRIADQPWPREP